MSDAAREKVLRDYIALYEKLPTADLGQLERLVTPDVRFKDPFNDLHGIENLRAILTKTLEDVGEPSFTVDGIWRSEEEATVILRWRFSGKVPVLKSWQVVGLTHLGFAPDGRICSHVDYWDAAEGFYARLPVIGSILRWIAKRLAV